MNIFAFNILVNMNVGLNAAWIVVDPQVAFFYFNPSRVSSFKMRFLSIKTCNSTDNPPCLLLMINKGFRVSVNGNIA